MISNPCNWFATGGGFNDMRQFTYEGGKEMWHFSPSDNKLEEHMCMNVIFAANDEKHALDVLRRMLEFKIDCKAQYIKYRETGDDLSPHNADFKHQAEVEESRAKKYLDAITANKVKLVKAPMNQFYIVGWAHNDTI